MGKVIDTTAAATASLVLTGRTLVALVKKGVLTNDEAHDLIVRTADEIASDDREQKAAVRHALKSVFPSAPL